MSHLPKFTVIIPVKDRVKYLYYTLKTCIMQEYPNLEILVADDASTDGTTDMVNRFCNFDKRVRLIHREQRIGMRDNFEFALNEVNEGYVIALGGDDGVLPNGIQKMYDTIQLTGTQLLTWSPPSYEYPSEAKPNGQFYYYRHKGIKKVDSSKYLARQSAALNYLSDIECPMFYVKGVVHIDLVKSVKSKSKDGRFYSCPTPDGYSGIVLAGEVDSFYFSSEPFTIFGASPSSQGAAYLSKSDKARKNSAEFFKFSESQTMHEKLANQPYSPLIALMTVDYLCTARDLPGWPGKVEDVDFKKVLAKSVSELASRYADNTLERELKILEAIAKQHNLYDYYQQLLAKAKRSVISPQYRLWAISKNNYYIDAKEFGVSNIFEAANAIPIILGATKYFGFSIYWKLFKSSVKLYFDRKKTVGKFQQQFCI